MNMIEIESILKDTKVERSFLQELILEQIQIRRTLINQMVGTLYPSILRDEIERLYELHKDISNEK